MKKKYTAPAVLVLPCRSCGMLALSIRDDETVDREDQVLSTEKEDPWGGSPLSESPWEEMK